MSNPGVYTLSRHTMNGNDFRVEDNIGEAIHLHYEEFRIDLSVRDFYEISDFFAEAANNLINVGGFRIEMLNPVFFSQIADKLADLRGVKIIDVKLKELKVGTFVCGIPVIRSIKNSRVVKALNGRTKELEHYKQENIINQTNIDRLRNNFNSIKDNGYPYNNEYIVIYNGQRFIHDGQHRAGSLYFIDPEQSVKVLDLDFGGKYNVKWGNWAYFNIKKLKRNIKPFVKKFLFKIKDVIKRIKYKIKG